MAVRPEEILRTLTVEDERLLAQLEPLIDNELRQRFDGTSRVQVSLPLTKSMRPALKSRLTSLYEAHGWTVTFSEGYQHNDYWCSAAFEARSSKRPRPTLSDEEERELRRLAAQGDIEAKDRLGEGR